MSDRWHGGHPKRNSMYSNDGNAIQLHFNWIANSKSIKGLMQKRHNSDALAMDLRHSCIKPLILYMKSSGGEGTSLYGTVIRVKQGRKT